MTIYNINFGIGWASSGVEYAQAYRAKLLRRTNQDTKFVFLDFIQSENIQTLTQNIGFKDQEVIWLYQYFSDISLAPTTYTLDDIERELGHDISFRERNGKIVRLYFNGKSSFVTCYLQNEQKDIVDRAEFVINSMLVRKDFYSYTRIFSEYYAPADNKAKLYMRQFYNQDGSIAYNEYIDGDSSIYVFEDAVLYNKTEFIAYFLQRLNLTRDDIVILDRASDIGQAVLQHKGDSKVGVVIHADHYSNNMMSEQHILWNNYYEYQFSKAKYIDFFITATDIQNHMVCRQFEQYQGYRPRVYTIPVGSIDALSYPTLSRKPYAMISASRLANEKHIDWLVKAVIVAKRQVPELTFDIYGEGSEKTRLRKIIDTHRAQDYIRLLGHVKLDEIYNDYELFLSASTSEGFGLTLMEAVGSGLGMIGLNVNYGNPTFIRDGENGYLVPFDTDEDSVDDVIAKLAHAIVMYFNNGPQTPHDISYEVAQQFMTQDIILKWETLVQECYMIKLFDYFNDHSRKLYESFKASKLEEDLTIVLNDNGFLPDDVISPYQFFADNHNTENMKPRFFNQVTVPAFWEIKGNNNSATINDMDVYEVKYFIKVESALELLVVSNGLMTNNVSDLSIIILRMVLNLHKLFTI